MKLWEGLAVAFGGIVVGGAGYAAYSHYNNEEQKHKAYEKGKAEGKNEGKAEREAELDDLTFKFNKAIEDSNKPYNVMIAMFAVAVSAANADGNICEEEKENIEMLVAGMASKQLPEKVLETFRKIYDNPPTLEKACAYIVEKSGVPSKDWDMFDEIIREVLWSDDDISEGEEEFYHQWQNFYSQAA